MKLIYFLGYFGRVNPDEIDKQKIEFVVEMEPKGKQLFLRRLEYDISTATWVARFGIK